jgi:glycosyl transferase family 2
MVALTIGMATYNGFDGVYFTTQALRLYQNLEDTEIVVADNDGCETTKQFVEGWTKGRYVLAKDVVGTAAALGEAAETALAITPAVAPRRRDYSPLVRCICMTYNRPPDKQDLVEEAIESFLRQTYPNKELIVLNDCPGQELICDAPGVRVINLPERFPTLGDKQNAAVRLSQGELIAFWDDDVNLPWRLAFSVDRLGAADYFNPRAYWFLEPAGLHADHAMGYAHNASLFTRAAFESVGGYPAISVGYDATMDGLLGTGTAHVVDPLRGAAKLTTGEWFYIYRWGVSPVHISGRGEGETFYQEIGARPVQPGTFRLHPDWRRDYVADTRALVTG